LIELQDSGNYLNINRGKHEKTHLLLPPTRGHGGAGPREGLNLGGGPWAPVAEGERLGKRRARQPRWRELGATACGEEAAIMGTQETSQTAKETTTESFIW
jgi:hypothetical protein